jgi:hypothetical protein
MRSLRARWIVAQAALAAAAASPGAARAQDEGFALTLDTVLVATFDANQSFLDAEAQRVQGLVTKALSGQFVVVPMAEVPPVQNDSAEVYMQSCPSGQYIGCVFVIGEKAGTDWSIGGRVSAVEGGYKVLLSFIDVRESKLRMDVSVLLDGKNDVSFQEGVLKAMDALVSGTVDQLERPAAVPIDDPVAAEAAAAERRALDDRAAQFAEDSTYEAPAADEPDAWDDNAEATPAPEPTSGGRVTGADLDAMAAAGGTPPWTRAGLSRSQYQLYRNSGVKLAEFQDRMLGRKGQILVRLSGGAGLGPYGQRHSSAFYVGADADLANLRARDVQDEAIVQSQAKGFGGAGEIEVDFGLMRFLEMGVFGGVRASPYTYAFVREVAGAEPVTLDQQVQSVVTWQVGARIGVIPMPAYPARPTLHVGASFWGGTPIGKLLAVPDYLQSGKIPPNNLVLVHINPGVEVSAGKWLIAFARADLDLPVAGRYFQGRYADNGRVLETVPADPVNPGLGVGGTLGVAVRLPVGPQRRN